MIEKDEYIRFKLKTNLTPNSISVDYGDRIEHTVYETKKEKRIREETEILYDILGGEEEHNIVMFPSRKRERNFKNDKCS